MILHQALDSVTGAKYQWTADTYDAAGAGYPGPNAPTNLIVLAGIGPSVNGSSINSLDWGKLVAVPHAVSTLAGVIAASGDGAVLAKAQTGLAVTPYFVSTEVDLRNWGIVYGSSADQSALLQAAHDQAPEGSTLLLGGPIKISSTVNWTRKVHLLGIGNRGVIIPDVGTANDGLIVGAPTIGTLLTGLRMQNIHVFGQGNVRKALVLHNMINAEISAHVKGGARGTGSGVAYDVEVSRLLVCNVQLTGSVNNYYPVSDANGMSSDGFFRMIRIDTDSGLACQSDNFDLTVEGCPGVSVYQETQGSLGGNRFTGTIQGGTAAYALQLIGGIQPASVSMFLDFGQGAQVLGNTCAAFYGGQVGGELNVDTFAQVDLYGPIVVDHIVSGGRNVKLHGNVRLLNTSAPVQGVIDAGVSTVVYGSSLDAALPFSRHDGANYPFEGNWLWYYDADYNVHNAGDNLTWVSRANSASLTGSLIAYNSYTHCEKTLQLAGSSFLTSFGVISALAGSAQQFICALQWVQGALVTNTHVCYVGYADTDARYLDVWLSATNLRVDRTTGTGTTISLPLPAPGDLVTLVICRAEDGNLYAVTDAGTSAGVADGTGTFTRIDRIDLNGFGASGSLGNFSFRRFGLMLTPGSGVLKKAQALQKRLSGLL